MKRIVQCPECEAKLAVFDFGEPINQKCPKCGNAFRVASEENADKKESKKDVSSMPVGVAVPMAMSKVAIVGVEGSGKTVLMGALCECYKQISEDTPYLMPENQSAFMFMERIPHKLRVERQWPEATSIGSLRMMKWTLKCGNEVFSEIEMLGYAACYARTVCAGGKFACDRDIEFRRYGYRPYKRIQNAKH